MEKSSLTITDILEADRVLMRKRAISFYQGVQGQPGRSVAVNKATLKINPSFQSLPVEMKDKILMNLDFSSKLAARRVCKEWKEIVDDKMKFNGTLSDFTWKYVKEFKQNMKQLIVEDLINDLPLSATRLDVVPFTDSLIFCGGVSSDNIVKLLRYKSQTLKYLTFESYSLVAVSGSGFMTILPRISFNLLTDLHFQIVPGGSSFLLEDNKTYNRHLSGVVDILKYANTPGLKTLHGEFNTAGHRYRNKFSYETKILMSKLLWNFLDFAGRHGTSLKELRLDFSSGTRIPIVMNLLDFSTLKLKTVMIKFDFIHYLAFVNILNLLTGVERLEILREFIVFPIDIGQHFATCIKNNSSSLIHLVMGVVDFQSIWIKSCLRLRSLSLRVLNHHESILNPICLPLLEEFILKYHLTGNNPPVNQILLWILESFPNLRKLKFHFSSHVICVCAIGLILGLQKLEILIVTEPEHQVGEIQNFCETMPGLTYIPTFLGSNTCYSYQIRIDRAQLLVK